MDHEKYIFATSFKFSLIMALQKALCIILTIRSKWSEKDIDTIFIS